MCTSMYLKNKNNKSFFGRTMDFSYELNPELYIINKNYEWESFDTKIKNAYKFIAIGQNIDKLIFADGMNELGLGAMALYFAGCAEYNEFDDSRLNLANTDIVNYILGNCSDVNDTIKKINNINIVGQKDSLTNSVVPLHWMIADKTGKCIVIEKTINGLEIFDNNVGVLANSPNFIWHLNNLRNYLNISPYQKDIVNWGEIVLKPFGQGSGSYGLPGDFTSPSRFIRTVYNKSFIESNNEISINDCFNIIKNVFITKGAVITNRNTNDYTQYVSFMDLSNGDYYFNTYDNNQIFKANINDYIDTVSLGYIKIDNYFKNIKNFQLM